MQKRKNVYWENPVIRSLLAMDGTASEAGSESPSSSRFKVVASPPPPSNGHDIASSSPIGSTKMNHVANTISVTSPTPPPDVQNGSAASAVEISTSDEKQPPMEPREPIVHSVPSIELPDVGKFLQ